MPRYFFHLVSRRETIQDREGVEITQNDAEQIGRIIDEIRAENPDLFEADGDWSIEVVDEVGRRVGTFPLRP